MIPSQMRMVVCEVLLVGPYNLNRSEYPDIWDEVAFHIRDCPWFKVYDICEALYEFLEEFDPGYEDDFQKNLNRYFRENGIGWEMLDGRLQFRGSDVFNLSVNEADRELRRSGLSVASREISEAVRDISRRPQPDLTGAIQHAAAAMEATAREVAGSPNPTFGKLARNLNLLPPLDIALEKLWGFSSERARHGREGGQLDATEAELVVSVACSVSNFLVKRHRD